MGISCLKTLDVKEALITNRCLSDPVGWQHKASKCSDEEFWNPVKVSIAVRVEGKSCKRKGVRVGAGQLSKGHREVHMRRKL